MICPPCKKAGKYVSEVRRAPVTGGPYEERMRDLLLTEAEKLHFSCEAPLSCPCMHKTEGLVIRDS